MASRFKTVDIHFDDERCKTGALLHPLTYDEWTEFMQETSTADAKWLGFAWEDGSFSTFATRSIQGIEFTDAV